MAEESGTVAVTLRMDQYRMCFLVEGEHRRSYVVIRAQLYCGEPAPTTCGSRHESRPILWPPWDGREVKGVFAPS